jgi:hypothetical protein
LVWVGPEEDEVNFKVEEIGYAEEDVMLKVFCGTPWRVRLRRARLATMANRTARSTYDPRR